MLLLAFRLFQGLSHINDPNACYPTRVETYNRYLTNLIHIYYALFQKNRTSRNISCL